MSMKTAAAMPSGTQRALRRIRTLAARSLAMYDQNRAFCCSCSATPGTENSFAWWCVTAASLWARRQIDDCKPSKEGGDHEHLRDALAPPIPAGGRGRCRRRVDRRAGSRCSGTHRNADARIRLRIGRIPTNPSFRPPSESKVRRLRMISEPSCSSLARRRRGRAARDRNMSRRFWCSPGQNTQRWRFRSFTTDCAQRCVGHDSIHRPKADLRRASSA